MAKNPFDGLEMRINMETREWIGSKTESCAMCEKVIHYCTDESVPLILTHIEKASLDGYKYFCSYECFEKWIAKFIMDSNKDSYA